MPLDVVVIGGGPAGAACGISLARQGLAVLILDRSNAGFRGGESLAPSAAPILRRLGLADALRAGSHLPCYANQSVWGSPELLETDFLRSPWGHGWHLDRRAFDQLLLHRAQSAGADIRHRARFVHAERQGGAWQLGWAELGGGRRTELSCLFIVDASGRSRAFLRRLRVPLLRADRQVARVAEFQCRGVACSGGPLDPDTRTLIEACPDGWWYTARIPGGKRIVMYFCDPDSASGATAHCGSTFLAALAETQYIRHKVKTEDYRLETDPITRSAASTRAGTTVGEDWLAVGDAAVSYDPLSAKGIETALRGGEEASKAIVGALRGDKSGLQQYANSLSSQWNTFQTERLRYYDMESRWPERSFWQSRRSPVNPTREISGATDETEPTT